ncbi:MAG: Gfo/Idh/MocA family protein [Fermentimonas sp.]|jgi:hypothetical protein
MKQDRRSFIKNIAMGTAGLGFAPNILANVSVENSVNVSNHVGEPLFNMCGYSAPKIDTVRVAFIGVGLRGRANLMRITYLEGVEIKSICDIDSSAIDKSQKILSDQKLPKAKVFTGSDDAWKKACDDPNIDLVIISVPRGPLHSAISIYAMEHDKHVAVEVPAIFTIDEAWNLVETSEKTKKHCMMMENCCYDFFELLTLNMVRQGFFGDIVHGDAAYIHSSGGADGLVSEKTRIWALEEKQRYNGNLYPTHGLGPVCQAMNINRGDKFTYMVSMSSDDFMRGEAVHARAQKDPYYERFDTNTYCGNMNTSIIRTEKGRTIMLQYDVTSPRVYSRIHMLSGTKASCLKYPLPGKIAKGEKWLSDEEVAELTDKYTPEVVKRIGDMAKKVGGHGGMDFLMLWRLIDCLRNGLPMDQDVYDAAAWSVIWPLSVWSVANKSKPVDIPDFTRGAWKTNEPVDVALSKGGSTQIRQDLLK